MRNENVLELKVVTASSGALQFPLVIFECCILSSKSIPLVFSTTDLA